MYKMSYPTQCVVEDCLIKVFNHLSSMGCKFPTLSKGCLSPSIATMGSIPESHKCPGTYGVLDGDVCTLTGVDIPIMVEEDGKHRKTVAIVAQDPLRDPNTLPPQVIVGTPFAFHNEVSCCKQTQVYRDIINGLLSDGFDVYVTDIWKCWFLCKFIKRGSWKIGNPYFDCLVAEMERINPDYVIMMGNLAQNMFDRKTFRNAISLSKKQLIRVPHPSGSANGLWKNIICKCDTNSKVVYVLNEVLKHQKSDKA